MVISAAGQDALLSGFGSLRASSVPAGTARPASELAGNKDERTVFAMFPVRCPVCRDAGREVTMGFLDHTMRPGDPIIRACSSPLGEAVQAKPVIGEPLTGSLDGVAYLSCPDSACGRRFGPYTARDLRRRLLRSWR
jgi:hypothetical protein